MKQYSGIYEHTVISPVSRVCPMFLPYYKTPDMLEQDVPSRYRDLNTQMETKTCIVRAQS